MEVKEIRLRIVQTMAPMASKHALSGDELVDICGKLEQYVTKGVTPAPKPKASKPQPQKG